MASSIVLVGMMGSGKTTTGEAVAERLGWDFVDSDRQVEARTGRTVADIWRTEGERGFRNLESEALADALAAAGRRPAVIAAAGGVVLDPRNRALLRKHRPVVWLRARTETLAARLGTGEGRPLLAGNPVRPEGPDEVERVLRRLEAERRPFYEETAGTVIDVDELTSEEVVERVVALAR